MAAFASMDRTPVETRDPLILDRVFRLRVAAWRARTPDFPDIPSWSDAFDDTGRHWVVAERGEVIAAARLTIHATLREAPDPELYRAALPEDLAGPIGVFTRLAVDARWAGRGLSQALDRVRTDAARAAGCRCLIGVTYGERKRVREMERSGFSISGPAGFYRAGPLKGVGSADGPLRAVVLHKPLDQTL